jgi:hypothetical protein
MSGKNRGVRKRWDDLRMTHLLLLDQTGDLLLLGGVEVGEVHGVCSGV